MRGVTLPTETVFVMEMSPIKFGLGATDEIEHDARRLGLGRVLIFTDRHVAELGLPERIRGLLGEEEIKAEIFDGVEVEPTDRSMEEAAAVTRGTEVDGYIAVGGGSTIDTCRAVNLLTTHPAPLLDYINKPVGKRVAAPGPLRPVIAVPTTAGAGSETTAVAVTHVLAQDVSARHGSRAANKSKSPHPNPLRGMGGPSEPCPERVTATGEPRRRARGTRPRLRCPRPAAAPEPTRVVRRGRSPAPGRSLSRRGPRRRASRAPA
jgi:hypothetical protein